MFVWIVLHSRNFIAFPYFFYIFLALNEAFVQLFKIENCLESWMFNLNKLFTTTALENLKSIQEAKLSFQ